MWVFEPPCRGKIDAVEPARLTRGVLKSIHPKVESGPTRETTMRHRLLAAAAATALIAAAHIAEAGQITYSLQNYAADQAGSTLTGSITTDGNLGTLTAADIVSWTWTVTPPVGATVHLIGIGSRQHRSKSHRHRHAASTFRTPDSKLRAPALVGQNANLEYRRDRLHDGVPDQYIGSPGVVNFWATNNPQMGGTDPWLIGVAASSVPEPSGAVLLGLGITGFVVAGARRRFSRTQCN